MKLTEFIRQQKKMVIFGVIVIIIALTAVMAPQITHYDPVKASLKDALQAPGSEHLFGTDTLGRDIFTRVIFGTRVSLTSTLLLLGIVLVTGSFLGIIAGFFGGFIDTIIMRIADIMIAFPDMILAIAIAGILGPNLVNSITAIAIVSWPRYARLSRSLVLKIKNRDYIYAAYITGSKNGYLLKEYFLPNILPNLIVTAATDVGTFMLSLASLSFLGFGVQPPTPEWGYMLSEGRQYMQAAPWMMIFPGLAIFIVVSVFNLFGDSVRDLYNPKSNVNKIIK